MLVFSESRRRGRLFARRLRGVALAAGGGCESAALGLAGVSRGCTQHPGLRQAGAARLGRQRSCGWLGKAGSGNGGKPAKERRARVLCEGREQGI